MARRWVIRDGGHVPAFWVVGLAMMLIAMLAGVVLVFVVGRRRRSTLEAQPLDESAGPVRVAGEVAEA